MKSSNYTTSAFNLRFIIISLLLFPGINLLYAQNNEATPDSYIDCTDIDLVFEEIDEPLTRAEISELRRQQMTRSLMMSDACKTLGSGSSNGGGNGSGNGSGNGTGGGQQSGSANAAVASSMKGTEQSTIQTRNRSNPATMTEKVDLANQTSQQRQNHNPVFNNGRAPLDIPTADTDNEIAERLRMAAQSVPESEPEKKRKLWNKYREYKGLTPRE